MHPFTLHPFESFITALRNQGIVSSRYAILTYQMCKSDKLEFLIKIHSCICPFFIFEIESLGRHRWLHIVGPILKIIPPKLWLPLFVKSENFHPLTGATGIIFIIADKGIIIFPLKSIQQNFIIHCTYPLTGIPHRIAGLFGKWRNIKQRS